MTIEKTDKPNGKRVELGGPGDKISTDRFYWLEGLEKKTFGRSVIMQTQTRLGPDRSRIDPRSIRPERGTPTEVEVRVALTDKMTTVAHPIVNLAPPIALGWLGLVQHLVYARFLHRDVPSPIVETVRPLLKHAITGGSIFLIHSIARSIYAYLLITNMIGTLAIPYWFCALLESPYVFGFVTAASTNTILAAEHFRMSILSFSTTMKCRQSRLESRHKRSLRKSITMAWLLGLVLTGAFVSTSLLQRAYLPTIEQELASMAECTLLATIPEPILCSVLVLFVVMECATSLSFVAVAANRRRHRRRRGSSSTSPFYELGSSADGVNRAQTDLRERFRLTNDYVWWRWLCPGIVAHKSMTVITLITILLVEYFRSFDDELVEIDLVEEWSSTVCMIVAQVSLIVPLTIHMARDDRFRSWSRTMIVRMRRSTEDRSEEQRV